MTAYIIDDREGFYDIALKIVSLSEVRRMAGICEDPEEVPGDSQSVMDALSAIGRDFSTFASARDYLVDEYGEDMSSLVAAIISEECPEYDENKDRDGRYGRFPLCAPWLSDPDWLDESAFENEERLVSILEDLAAEAVEEFKTRSE